MEIKYLLRCLGMLPVNSLNFSLYFSGCLKLVPPEDKGSKKSSKE
jgi:hypothetical protein